MGKPLPDLEAEAAMCEDARLDGVWYPDYQGPSDPDHSYPELFVTLTVLARATRQIFVGSLVTDVLRRHPMVTAHAFATLSHLAPGRVVLGLGAGGGTSHLPFGIALDEPAARLREGIEVIQRLWRATSAAPADFGGKFFRLRRAVLPVRPRESIPLYIAACGPRMLRVAGAAGDGWVPEAHTPETYREARSLVEAARPSPDAGPFDYCVALLFFPFEADAAQRHRLLRAAKVMLAFNVDILRRLLPAVVPAGLRSTDVAAQPQLWRQLEETIPDEVAEQTTLLGPVDACVQRVRHYLAAGCRHVVLEPYWRMTSAQIREAIAAAAAIRTALQLPA
jgi:phthiodiolone/phenolphthiodiolone dimycocerosates ketoreductase